MAFQQWTRSGSSRGGMAHHVPACRCWDLRMALATGSVNGHTGCRACLHLPLQRYASECVFRATWPYGRSSRTPATRARPRNDKVQAAIPAHAGMKLLGFAIRELGAAPYRPLLLARPCCPPAVTHSQESNHGQICIGMDTRGSGAGVGRDLPDRALIRPGSITRMQKSHPRVAFLHAPANPARWRGGSVRARKR